MSATRLLVVRHGESTWNAEARWQGQADPPLSPLGERQSLRAAEQLAAASFAGVWTSDLARSRRTAELIAGRLGVDAVRVDSRLRERDAGEWSGLTRDEIEAGWPGYLASRRAPPGFEADAELVARSVEGIAAAANAAGPGDVLVVTHGGVVRAVERLLGAPSELLPNLGGRWLVSTDGALELGERVVLIDPHDAPVQAPATVLTEQEPVNP